MYRSGLLIVSAVLAVTASGRDDLEQATAAFERHNYKAALEIVDRYLAAQPAGTDLAEPGPAVNARLIRGQCLLKLDRWDEGVAELEALLAVNEQVAQRQDVHEALGEVGLQQHQYRYLAAKHYGLAADLHEAKGNAQAAAADLIKKAEGFVGLTAWDRLPELKITNPDDWREQRRIQRQFAAAALDRAISLAGDSELAAEALLRKAQLYHSELYLDPADIDTALKFYAQLVKRWPAAARAPEAAFQIAEIKESVKEDYVAAAEQYLLILQNYAGTSWAKRADRHFARIVEPTLFLAVASPVLPGEPGLIHYQCRNVTTITLRAYRVDLFALIRTLNHWHKLDDWAPSGSPAATWTVTVPDTGEHKFFNSNAGTCDPATLPVQDPGAYVIVAETADGQAQARTMMVVSRLAAVVKSARSAVLVTAADAGSGQPAASAEVLVQQPLGKDRYQYDTGQTDDAGRYRRVHTVDPTQDGIGGEGLIVVRDGPHYAVCDSSFYWYWWGYGDRHRGYCFTERPVYRPDQVIHFKAILRGYERGVYETLPARKLEMTVYDPRGEVIDTRELTTNEEGSASGDLHLPDQAALGLYRIQLAVEGRPCDTGEGAQFRVEEYRKPEFEVTVTAAGADHRVGDEIEARIEARYYFGEPVVGAAVHYTVHRSRYFPRFPYPMPWPWYFEDVMPRAGPDKSRMLAPRRWPPWDERRDLIGTFEATTDEQGVAIVRLKTQAYEDDPDADLLYHIDAEVTDASRRVIAGSGQIKVTHAPFYIDVNPQRTVYQPGDTVRLEVSAKTPNEQPFAFRGMCNVYRLVRDVVPDQPDAPDKYRLGDKVFERPVTVGADGCGQVQWVADEEGPFRVVVVADQGGDLLATGSADLWIARRGGRFAHYAYRDLELVLDRRSYAVGDTANVLINTRFDSCYVLLSAEADDLFDDRIVFIKGGTHLVELPITKSHVPNFELTATVLRDNKVYQDQLPVVVPPVDRFLNVSVTAPGKEFHPQQKVALAIAATDSGGQPAPAEVALMMVDASIYYIQPEFRPRIEKHFYGQKRPQLVRTHTSFDWGGAEAMPALAYTEAGDTRGRELRDMGLPRAAKLGAAPEMDAGAAGEQFALAEIRKDFPDTVLWAAHVLTDQAGRASVEVTMPDTLTTWRVHAIAVDRDTRVGQTAIDLITRKDVIVRLETPRFLVERDEPLLTVIAHNYLPQEKTVQVSLAASDQIALDAPMFEGRPVPGAESGKVQVRVPPGGEVAVEFPARALSAGLAELTATAAADVDADAVQITLPVIPYGADRFVAQSGAIRQGDASDTHVLTLTVPQEVAPDTPQLEVQVNPSIAAVMIDALPYLLEYPYGCTEQTMSRFLPAVVVRRTLQQLGIDLADAAAKIKRQGGPAIGQSPSRLRTNPVFHNAVMDDMIRTGLDRLATLQHSDGGWGWWAEGESNPYMTAYAVYGLTEAAAADLAFDRGMLDRGIEFLVKRVVSPEAAAKYSWAADDDNVRTWMLYALARHDPKLLTRPEVAKVLDRIYADRDGLSDYCRAMLMIVLHRTGQRDRADILVENLYNTVRLDDELQTASWCDRGSYHYWYDNGLEATAMVLRALLVVRPDHEYVPRAVNWLVRNRRGSRWFSTKDTAFAVYALADYLVASGELRADMTIEVTIDGRPKGSFRITPDNVLTFDGRIMVDAAGLPPGEHRVELRRTGEGNLYYAAYLDYFTRQDPIEPAGHEVFVTRKYARLVPKEVTKTRQVYNHEKRKYVEETYQAIDYDRMPIQEGDALASGDLIEVQLEIEAKNNFEYMIFEDPKPAGCEPVELHSGYPADGGPCVAVELRDQKTAFFATYLSQGRHPLTYRLRCETPGLFHALPARAEAMYTPYVKANGRSDKLTVHGS